MTATEIVAKVKELGDNCYGIQTGSNLLFFAPRFNDFKDIKAEGEFIVITDSTNGQTIYLVASTVMAVTTKPKTTQI